jgi:hypothetical protein
MTSLFKGGMIFMGVLRRGRIGLSDRWDSSGRSDRNNYLTDCPHSCEFA